MKVKVDWKKLGKQLWEAVKPSCLPRLAGVSSASRRVVPRWRSRGGFVRRDERIEAEATMGRAAASESV